MIAKPLASTDPAPDLYVYIDGSYEYDNTRREVCVNESLYFFAIGGDETNIVVLDKDENELTTQPSDITAVGGGVMFSITPTSTGNFSIIVKNCIDDGEGGDLCDNDNASNKLIFKGISEPEVEFKNTTYTFVEGADSDILDDTYLNITNAITDAALTFSGEMVQYDGANYYFDPYKAGTYNITASYKGGGCNEVTNVATFEVVKAAPKFFIVDDNGDLIETAASGDALTLCTNDTRKVALYKDDETDTPTLFIDGNKSSYSSTVNGEYIYWTIQGSDFLDGDIPEITAKFCADPDNCSSESESNTIYVSVSDPESLTFSQNTYNYNVDLTEIGLDATFFDETLTGGSLTFSGEYVSENSGSYSFHPSASGNYTIAAYYTKNGCTQSATTTFDISAVADVPDVYLVDSNGEFLKDNTTQGIQVCISETMVFAVKGIAEADIKFYIGIGDGSSTNEDDNQTDQVNMYTSGDFVYVTYDFSDDDGQRFVYAKDNNTDATSDMLFFYKNDPPTVSFKGSITTDYLTSDASVVLTEASYINNTSASGTGVFSGSGVSYDSGSDEYTFNPGEVIGDVNVYYTFTDGTTGCEVITSTTFSITDPDGTPEAYFLKDDALIANTSSTSEDYCSGDDIFIVVLNGNTSETKLFQDGSELSLTPQSISGGVIFTVSISSIDSYDFYAKNCNDDPGNSDNSDYCIDETASNTIYVTINDIPSVTWDSNLQTTYSNADSEVNLNENISVPAGGTVIFSGSGVYQVGEFYYFYPSAVGNHEVTATYTSDTGCPNSASITFSVYDANASVSMPDLADNYCESTIGTQTLDVILSDAFAYEQGDFNSFSTECERRTTYNREIDALYLRDNTGGIHYFTGGTWNSGTKTYENAQLDIQSLGLDSERSYYLYIEYTRTTTYDSQSNTGYTCALSTTYDYNDYTRYVDQFYLKSLPTVDIVVNDGTSSGALASDYCIRESDHFIYPVLNGGEQSYEPSLWQFDLINVTTNASEASFLEGNKLLFSTLPAGAYEITTTYTGNSLLCGTSATSTQFSIIGDPVVSVSDTTDSATPEDVTAGIEFCEGEGRRAWVVNIDSADVLLADLNGFTVSPDPGTSPLVLEGSTLYFYPDSLEAGFNYSFTYSFVTGSCDWSQSWNVFINPTPTPSFSGLVSEYCLGDGEAVLSPLSGFEGGDYALRDAVSNTIEVVDTDSVFTERNGLTYFNPGILEAGSYSIIYTFQDENGCPGISDPQKFTIREPASTGFSYENVCLGDSLILTPDAIDSAGYSFRWVFGDGTFTEEAVGKKLITTDQSLFVTLYVTDDLGCVSDSSMTVETYPLPESNFTAYGFCTGYTTTFDATEAFAKNLEDSLTITAYAWDFGDGTTDFTNDPVITHSYATAGSVNVSLTVETDKGCTGSFTKKYFIYPVIDAEAYFEGFESYDQTTSGWVNSSVIEDGSSSWQLHYADSTGFVWQTNAEAGTYANNESSYIESPCFDESGLTDPVLALDIWRDTDSGADGTVMLYSVDGGLNWKLLGDTDMGIDWFNSEGILGVPGGDINDSRRVGWSGTDSSWTRSRLGLTDVLNDGAADTLSLYDGTFRLRMAFGSNADNPGTDFHGFGFDNIYIGNKNRKVIIEHFAEETDATALSDAATVAAWGDSHNDVIHLQYDIPTGSSSNVIRDGSQSARALYYGISEGPVAVIDGRYMDLHESFTQWGEEKYSQESLIAAPYDLTVSYIGGTGGDPLAIEVNILRNDQQEAVGTVVGPVYVHTMIVKNSETVDGQALRNRFVTALPDAGGTRIEGDWLEGSARYETINLEYFPEESIGAGEYSIVVFIQSGDNFGELNQYDRPVYEVHQAIQQEVGQSLEAAVISGVRDEVNDGVLSVYPVPATDRLVLDFGNWLEDDITYELTDILGRVLKNGHVRRGSDTEELNVSNLQNGTYQVWIRQEGKKPVMKQLLILR
ncbi:MAG: PKD domain-containing protein [Cyclobacteriaceae bacterium]